MKLLPFRQYAETDVINGFAYDLSSGDAGTFVSVSANNLSDDPVKYVTRNTAAGGWQGYDHVTSQYPYTTAKVTVAAAQSRAASVLGFLTRDVKETDENGNKLIFDSVKKDELQCVVSGEANPVAMKGVWTFSAGAIDGSPSVGQALVIASAGKISGVNVASLGTTGAFPSTDHVVGTVLGTGIRVSQSGTDAWAGAYIVAKITL